MPTDSGRQTRGYADLSLDGGSALKSPGLKSISVGEGGDPVEVAEGEHTRPAGMQTYDLTSNFNLVS